MQAHFAGNLLELASVMDDAVEVVNSSLEKITSSKKAKIDPEVIQSFTAVAKFCKTSKETIKASARGQGGTGTAYAAQSREAEKKKQMHQNHIERTPLKNIENYTNSHDIDTKRKMNIICNKDSNMKKMKTDKKISESLLFVKSNRHSVTRSNKQLQQVIPRPQDDNQYTPIEAVSILSGLRSASAVINSWVENKLVPCKKTCIYKLLNEFRNGKSPRYFSLLFCSFCYFLFVIIQC